MQNWHSKSSSCNPFFIQFIKFHRAQNLLTSIESIHVGKLRMLTTENLVNVPILAKAYDRANKQQIEVVPQNLDDIAKAGPNARPHSGRIADDVTVRIEL